MNLDKGSKNCFRSKTVKSPLDFPTNPAASHIANNHTPATPTAQNLRHFRRVRKHSQQGLAKNSFFLYEKEHPLLEQQCLRFTMILLRTDSRKAVHRVGSDRCRVGHLTRSTRQLGFSRSPQISIRPTRPCGSFGMVSVSQRTSLGEPRPSGCRILLETAACSSFCRVHHGIFLVECLANVPVGVDYASFGTD